MTPETLQKYLNADLIQEVGLENMTPEEAVTFFDAFGNIVWQRIVLRLNDALTDEQKDRLDILMEKDPDNAQAVGAFFMAEVPAFTALVDEEVAGYKKEIIERMKAPHDMETPA